MKKIQEQFGCFFVWPDLVSAHLEWHARMLSCGFVCSPPNRGMNRIQPNTNANEIQQKLALVQIMGSVGTHISKIVIDIFIRFTYQVLLLWAQL